MSDGEVDILTIQELFALHRSYEEAIDDLEDDFETKREKLRGEHRQKVLSALLLSDEKNYLESITQLMKSDDLSAARMKLLSLLSSVLSQDEFCKVVTSAAAINYQPSSPSSSSTLVVKRIAQCIPMLDEMSDYQLLCVLDGSALREYKLLIPALAKIFDRIVSVVENEEQIRKDQMERVESTECIT